MGNNKLGYKIATRYFFGFCWWTLNNILAILFKCKSIYKFLIWIDYVIRYKKSPPKILLSDDKNFIILKYSDNYIIECAFYYPFKYFGQYEIVN